MKTVADLVIELWLLSTLVVTVNVYFPAFKIGKVITSPDTLGLNSVPSASLKVAITSPVEFSAPTSI